MRILRAYGIINNQHEQNDYQKQVASHATKEFDVIIANEQGEYVCYAGMWRIPKNKLGDLRRAIADEVRRKAHARICEGLAA